MPCQVPRCGDTVSIRMEPNPSVARPWRKLVAPVPGNNHVEVLGGVGIEGGTGDEIDRYGHNPGDDKEKHQGARSDEPGLEVTLEFHVDGPLAGPHIDLVLGAQALVDGDGIPVANRPTLIVHRAVLGIHQKDDILRCPLDQRGTTGGKHRGEK